jgi:uncharacterized protein (DUF1697 family)
MRYVAFLRAINVGGRVVKMDELRRLFTAMGFGGVQTFIASGNVIFDSPSRSPAKLEATIEKALEKALGYPVATFIRSVPELAALAEHPLVSGATVPKGASLYVVFLREAPPTAYARKLGEFNTPVDRFELAGREVFWMVQGNLLDSAVSGAKLEKTLSSPGTMRNATTVRRLAAKLAN